MMNKKAIFFDLDGTLLPVDLDTMFGAYFELLRKSEMIRLISGDPEEAFQIFNSAAREMMANMGRDTNDAVFFEYIEKMTGRGKPFYVRQFNEFYSSAFKSLSGMVPNAGIQRRILDIARQKGYRTVLATMPVFPVAATISRLSWIGLNAGDFDYISHWENSSYFKPSPEYYIEVLQKLGLEAKDCIMVGNNIEEDMCAQRLGFEVFLVTGYEIGAYKAGVYKSGDLAALLKWVKKLPPAEVQ